MKISDLEDVSVFATERCELLETLRDEDLPKFKELFRVVVPKIVVESRSNHTAVRQFALGSLYGHLHLRYPRL